jgi:hypothetical protein
MEPLNSWDPIWAMGHVFLKLAKDAVATRSWIDKLKIWWMPPGWKPTDLAQALPVAPASPKENQLYNPAMSRSTVWFAGLHMLMLFAALSLFLWYEDTLPAQVLAAIAVQLIASLWIVGAVIQGRLAAGKGLWIELLLLITISSGLRFL